MAKQIKSQKGFITAISRVRTMLSFTTLIEQVKERFGGVPIPVMQAADARLAEIRNF